MGQTLCAADLETHIHDTEDVNDPRPACATRSRRRLKRLYRREDESRPGGQLTLRTRQLSTPMRKLP